MNINLTQVLFHVSLFWVLYLFYRWIYKNIMHTNYRWQQQGNICYEYRRDFAIRGAIITGILIELIFVFHILKFHF